MHNEMVNPPGSVTIKYEGPLARTTTTPMRTLSKNIISHYCNNFAIPQSLTMESVSTHFKNKIGEDSVDIYREN